MTSPPESPRRVFKMLANIEDALKELREGYPSDYEAGYATRRGSIPEIRRNFEPSDPTGNAVAELEHIRKTVAGISQRVAIAHAAIEEACAALIKPVQSGRKCPRCRRIIRRPRGRRSGLCDSCDRSARRQGTKDGNWTQVS